MSRRNQLKFSWKKKIKTSWRKKRRSPRLHLTNLKPRLRTKMSRRIRLLNLNQSKTKTLLRSNPRKRKRKILRFLSLKRSPSIYLSLLRTCSKLKIRYWFKRISSNKSRSMNRHCSCSEKSSVIALLSTTNLPSRHLVHWRMTWTCSFHLTWRSFPSPIRTLHPNPSSLVSSVTE